jgi:hypothetical protein
MAIQYKLVSTSLGSALRQEHTITELLNDSLSVIKVRLNSSSDIDKESLDAFVSIRALLGAALLNRIPLAQDHQA